MKKKTETDISRVAEHMAASCIKSIWMRRMAKGKKVYLVLGDDDYPYGIFSSWMKAYSWIRKEIKADASDWTLKEMKRDRSYIHPYEIEAFVVDKRLDEAH